jgi:4-hydroxy-tetrahydrodipicolinate reductase
LDRDWYLGDSGWRIQIQSDTPLDVKIEFPKGPQSHADQMSSLTAHPAVNAIPHVLKAKPGIRINPELATMSPWLA